MDASQTFCPNCRKNIATPNYVIHSVHCERKIHLCQLCNEPVPRSELDHHLVDSHSLENCLHCELPIERWKHPAHKEECVKRPVSCQFCNLENAFDKICEHEEICGSRTERCMSCDVFVQLKDRGSHSEICQKNNSLKSMVVCNYCELEIFEHKYPEHEVICGARTEKCGLCEEFVTLKDQEYHQKYCRKNNSFESLIVCKYCELPFPDHKYSEHELACRSLTEKCGFCGKFVIFKDQEHHHKYCRKVSESRTEKCDICDEFIGPADLKYHQKYCGKNISCELLVACKYCELEFPADKYPEHEFNCGSLTKKCGLCMECVELKNLKYHQKYCKKNKIPSKEPIFCEYCLTEYSREEYILHKSKCESRTEKCYKCNAFVEIKKADFHREICQGENAYGPIETKTFSRSRSPVEYAQEIDSDQRSVPCTYCNVEFPMDCLKIHVETCRDRSEVCQNCKKSVTFKDKIEHNRSCMEHMQYDKIKCPVCFESFRHQYQLEQHCKICLEINTEGYIETLKESKSIHKSDKVHNASNTSSIYPIKRDADIPNKDMKTCPYCFKILPEQRFKNHKKYCSKALKICPFCEETFHVEEESMHSATCDVLIKNEKETSFKDPNNRFSMLEDEKNLKEYEVPFKACSFCDGKISLSSYEEHVYHCSKELKQCKFCQEVYHKQMEKDHMEKCIRFNRDQFIYSDLQDVQSSENETQELFNMKKYESCPNCHEMILLPYLGSHVKFNCVKKVSCFCKKMIHVRDIDHLEKCWKKHAAKKKDQFVSVGSGARPKNQEKDKPGLLSKVKDGFKYFVGSVTGTSVHNTGSFHHSDYSGRSITNYTGPSNYSRRDETYNRDSKNYATKEQEILANTKIPCEFCGEMIPMDEIAIVLHESGCSPNLVKVPQPIIENQEKNTAICDTNEPHFEDASSSGNRKEKSFHLKQNCSEIESNYVAENPQIKEEHIQNYSYMQNFNKKYANEDNILEPETFNDDHIKNASSYASNGGNQFKKGTSIEGIKPNLEAGNKISEYLESNNRFKDEVTSTEEFKKNLFAAEQNRCNKVEDNSFTQKTNSEKNSIYGQSKHFTKPGEFLESSVTFHQSGDRFDTEDLFKRNSQIPKVDTIENVSDEKKEKLYDAWNALDTKNVQLSKREVYNAKDNHEYYKNKVCPYDSGKVEPVVKDDKRESKLKFNQEFHEVIDSDISNTKSFQYNSYSIISTEVKGPLKIERLRRTSDTVREINQNKLVTENLVHEKYYENQNDSNLEIFPKDLFESNIYPLSKKSVKERIMMSQSPNYLYDSQFNQISGHVIPENLQSKDNVRNTSQCPNQLEDCQFNRKMSDEQPMETDDEHHGTKIQNNVYPEINNLSIINIEENDFINVKKSNKVEISRNLKEDNILASPNFSDSETEDSNLDSFYHFLDADNLRANSCSVCGNEMCLCKINESISAVRNSSFSDDSGNTDFSLLEMVKQEGKKQLNEMKILKLNKEEKVPDEKWNKWRATSTSSDDE